MRTVISDLGAAFERLSSREQRLLLLVGLLLFISLVGFTSYFVGRDLDRREKRIAAKAESLEELGALKIDYQRRLAEQNRLAAEIRKNNTVRLLSYIEDIYKKTGIDVASMQEGKGGSTGSELLKEEAAEVTVKNVTINRLYDFLKRLEEGNRLVKVRGLKVKRRFDNPKMLDATVTVGTFKTTS
jgi:type II secretory pathway component PulM